MKKFQENFQTSKNSTFPSMRFSNGILSSQNNIAPLNKHRRQIPFTT